MDTEPIRERIEQWRGGLMHKSLAQAHEDRCALLAEVDRLRDAIEQHRDELDGTFVALLDVAKAAQEIVSPDYRDAPEPYAQGVRLDAMHDLMDALDLLSVSTSASSAGSRPSARGKSSGKGRT